MNARALFSLSLRPLARRFDDWRLQREIARTERDLELTTHEIAEKLRTKNELQSHLMHLRRAQQ